MATNREQPRRGPVQRAQKTDMAAPPRDAACRDVRRRGPRGQHSARQSGARARDRSGSAATSGNGCSATELRRSGLERGPERLHRRRADAADLVELVDRGEPAVLVAELDDLLRRHRPDALDPVELLDGRAAEADRAALPPGRRGRCVAPRPGTTTCWPSLRRAARLIASAIRPAGEAAGPPDRVGDARAGRQPVDARAPDRAGDVHDHIPRPLGLVRGVGREAELRAAARAAAARADPARADQQQRRRRSPRRRAAGSGSARARGEPGRASCAGAAAFVPDQMPEPGQLSEPRSRIAPRAPPRSPRRRRPPRGSALPAELDQLPRPPAARPRRPPRRCRLACSAPSPRRPAASARRRSCPGRRRPGPAR